MSRHRVLRRCFIVAEADAMIPRLEPACGRLLRSEARIGAACS